MRNPQNQQGNNGKMEKYKIVDENNQSENNWFDECEKNRQICINITKRKGEYVFNEETEEEEFVEKLNYIVEFDHITNECEVTQSEKDIMLSNLEKIGFTGGHPLVGFIKCENLKTAEEKANQIWDIFAPYYSAEKGLAYLQKVINEDKELVEEVWGKEKVEGILNK